MTKLLVNLLVGFIGIWLFIEFTMFFFRPFIVKRYGQLKARLRKDDLEIKVVDGVDAEVRRKFEENFNKGK